VTAVLRWHKMQVCAGTMGRAAKRVHGPMYFLSLTVRLTLVPPSFRPSPAPHHTHHTEYEPHYFLHYTPNGQHTLGQVLLDLSPCLVVM
jgi:hypothetical protein